MNRNGHTRIPEGYPVTDVPAPRELSPKEKAERAERRRERWETVWSVAILAAVLVIAVAGVVACVALNDIAAENRRVNALTWGK